MKSRKIVIIILIVTMMLSETSFSIINQTEAWTTGYNSNYDGGTHAIIMNRALETLKADGYQKIYDFFKPYLYYLNKGSCQADGCDAGELGVINAAEHYMNPITHSGLVDGITFKSAGQLAIESWVSAMTAFANGDTNKGYENLGKVFHLIMDLTQPYHSTLDDGGALLNHDANNNAHKGYELYVDTNWDNSFLDSYSGPGMYELNTNDGSCSMGLDHCKANPDFNTAWYTHWPFAWADYAAHMSYPYASVVKACNPNGYSELTGLASPSQSTDPCVSSEIYPMKAATKYLLQLAVRLVAGAMKQAYIFSSVVGEYSIDPMFPTFDNSFYENDLTNYGITFTEPGPFIDISANFDGNDYATLPNLGNSGEGTLMFWVKLDNSNGGAQYLMDGRGTGNWWLLQDYVSGACTDSNGNICFNGLVQIPSAMILSNVWYQITLTADSSYTRLYLNGELVSIGSGLAMDLRSVRLGTRYTNSNYLRGNMDDVWIFNKALDPGDVAQFYGISIFAISHQNLETNLMNQGEANSGSFSGSPSDVILNGGFESGNLSPWKTSSYPSAVTTDPWHVHSGSWGLRLYQYSSSNYMFYASSIEQPVSVPVSNLNQISFWLRAYTSTKITVYYEDGSTPYQRTISANYNWGQFFVNPGDLSSGKVISKIRFDRIGNSYSGTAIDDIKVMVNGPAYTAGMIGKAIKFDGANDYVRTPQTSAFDLIKNEVTLSAWVNPRDTAGENMIINKESDYEIAIKDGYFYWAINTVGQTWLWETTYTQVPVNQWSHLAITFDGYNVRAYFDGQLVSTHWWAYGAITNHGQDLGIGARGVKTGASSFFDGIIDEPTVYSIALGGNWIKDYYDQSIQRVFLPLSYDGHDHSVWETPASVNNVNFGTYSGIQSGLFDGSSSYASITTNLGLQTVGSSVKYSVWVRPSKSYSNEPNDWYYFAMGQGNPSGTQFEFGYQGWSDAIEFKPMATNGQTYGVAYAMTLYAYAWYHIEATIVNNVVSLYLNGNLVAQRTDFPTGQYLMPWNTYIGGTSWGTRYFNGAISNFEISVIP